MVTLDTISHEGVLEDQGKEPRQFFESYGVPERSVLRDAVDVAAHAVHDGPGPHVITGPIAVRGAEPGDVLKVEVLDLALRVPYGVISNREGKGALPGEYPQQFRGAPRTSRTSTRAAASVSSRPSTGRTGGCADDCPATYPWASTWPRSRATMGVARDTSAVIDSVPPTDAGGNIDINDLTVGSTLYLPVQVPGAMFFSGDPHMVQGDGEVALTAMEGSLRPTFRLTLVKRGERGAPTVAFSYPFAETADHWIPIGLTTRTGPRTAATRPAWTSLRRPPCGTRWPSSPRTSGWPGRSPAPTSPPPPTSGARRSWTGRRASTR